MRQSYNGSLPQPSKLETRVRFPSAAYSPQIPVGFLVLNPTRPQGFLPPIDARKKNSVNKPIFFTNYQ